MTSGFEEPDEQEYAATWRLEVGGEVGRSFDVDTESGIGGRSAVDGNAWVEFTSEPDPEPDPVPAATDSQSSTDSGSGWDSGPSYDSSFSSPDFA